jgi:hypothetical protein
LSSRKKTLAGSQPERVDDVLESVAVGFDPAGQVRNEAVLEERAEAELVFDPGPVNCCSTAAHG